MSWPMPLMCWQYSGGAGETNSTDSQRRTGEHDETYVHPLRVLGIVSTPAADILHCNMAGCLANSQLLQPAAAVQCER